MPSWANPCTGRCGKSPRRSAWSTCSGHRGRPRDIARQAVAAGATALWLQLGIASRETRAIAEGAGLLYVEDRCLIIEQRRLQLQAPGSRQ